MLVALLHQNPEAFIGGNVNRVKSGAVLQIPDRETVAALPATQAAQTIVAQSADFNAFRRNLAGNVPTAAMANADQQASGKLQAKVEDRAPASTVPDKLTLSKEAVAGKAAASAEQQIATARQASDSALRVAALSKNISDLNKLGVASAAATAAASGLRTPASAVAVLTPAAVAVPSPTAKSSAPVSVSTPPAAPVVVAPGPATVTSAAVSPASAGASAAMVAIQPGRAAAGAAAPASASAVSPASAPVMMASAASDTAIQPLPTASSATLKSVPVADAAKPSLLEDLMETPVILTGLALLAALLGGFAFFRNHQRKQSTQIDSSFLESRLQPDSFFGASGGQRIDTNDGGAAGSSLVYSPSQLDATGDVDPVAEADVYLAYGRDLQAEEILKEALRTTPLRVAIHAKLLEIYAKRQDVKAFGVIATEAFKLTRGEGSEWRHITEMGRELDPGNSMYLLRGQPPVKPANDAEAFNGPANGGGFGFSTLPLAIEPQVESAANAVNFDLDLDLDFFTDKPTANPPVAEKPGIPAAAAAAVSKHAVTPMPVPPTPMFEDFSMDFASSKAILPNAGLVAQKPAIDEPLSFDSIVFPDESDFKKPSLALPAHSTTAPVASNAPLEFDMSDLSLDLSGPVMETSPYAGNAMPEDPLETKFLLAQEFSSLGDPEGARALVEEVLLEAKGPLKIKAQTFLNALF